MSVSLASKSASGAHHEGLPPATALPLAAGTRGEQAALAVLLEHARGAGLGGARVQGFAGQPRAHAAEGAHALLGAVAMALSWAWTEGGAILLGLVALSAAVRCTGLRGAASLLPRSPCFNLVLRGRGPRTRRVVVAALDRTRPVPSLRWAVLGGVAAALLARLLGPNASAVVGVTVLGVAAWAWIADRPAPPRVGAPEAEAAAAVLAEALRLEAAGDDEVAVLLSGCAAERGEGAAAFCDWWALSGAEVILVGGSPSAEAALRRAGHPVRLVHPAALGARS